MHRYLFSFSKYFFLVAVVGLIFAGCQNIDKVSSPVDPMDKSADALVWGDPISMGDLDNGPIEVELIAGQFYKVGMVKVEKFNGGIKVTYTTDITGGYIDEVHVDLASTLSIWNGTSDLTGFHVTATGNPSFGKFDSKDLATITSNEPDNTIWEVVFTEANLKTALGVNALNQGTKFYIAAHSGVCFPGTGGGTGPAFCPAWVSGVALPMTALPRDANFTMTETPYPMMIGGVTYGGYCADPGLEAIDVGVTADFLFICLDGSFVWPVGCGAFESFDNFDVINYFLNLNLPPYETDVTINGNIYNIGKKDAQMVVWCLLFPSIDGSTFNGGIGGANHPAYFPAILNDLQAVGNNFVPQCGDYIGVVAYDAAESITTLCERSGTQPFILRVPSECGYTCETAMGFDAAYNSGDDKWYAVPGNSSLFPGHIWFRYFAFTW